MCADALIRRRRGAFWKGATKGLPATHFCCMVFSVVLFPQSLKKCDRACPGLCSLALGLGLGWAPRHLLRDEWEPLGSCLLSEKDKRDMDRVRGRG